MIHAGLLICHKVALLGCLRT